jgi:hypothetical protein
MMATPGFNSFGTQYCSSKKDKPGGGSHRAREKREEGFSYGVLGGTSPTCYLLTTLI